MSGICVDPSGTRGICIKKQILIQCIPPLFQKNKSRSNSHRSAIIQNIFLKSSRQFMMDKLNPVLQWLNSNPEYSGLITFGIAAAESIAIIGTVIPGTVMMTAIGTLAGMGIIPLWYTIFWAMIGAIAGDGISYWLGRMFNERLPFLWPFKAHPYLLESGERFFRKHGWLSVFIGRFVGPVRALIPLVAGMLNMSPFSFTVANVLSAIGWAPLYMLPGILLGAASLELPPDVALHVILSLLMTTLLLALCFWLLTKFFKLIRKQIDRLLTNTWRKLHHSKYFSLITSGLQHYDAKRTHGQLTLAFYFLITCGLLAYLFFTVVMEGSENIDINNICFYLFRSLRTPTGDTIMLAIAFLGEKTVLLPLSVTLFAWLAYAKRWRTAWHVLALGVLAVAGIVGLKCLSHSPRPWGILHNTEEYSFPSGHTTLAVTYYFGITLLLIKAMKIRARKLFYYAALVLIAAVSLSRLYFGVHWFTDIVAGWLLGATILMLVSLSYNRKSEKPLHPTGIILTILLTLSATYTLAVTKHFSQLKTNYTQLGWPTQSISLNNWWNRQGDHLPLYRVNRFGISGQILNVQWLGDLNEIKNYLLQNGWRIPPQPNVASVLHRLSDIDSTEHLPLVSPLYLDKNPVLVLIKQMNNKSLIAFRLWDSHLIIQNSSERLWVGSVEFVPRTYSWLFKRKQREFTLTPAILFKQVPHHDEIRTDSIQVNYGTQRVQPMILIKPQTGK